MSFTLIFLENKKANKLQPKKTPKTNKPPVQRTVIFFSRLMSRGAAHSVEVCKLNWPCWLYENVPGCCFSPVLAFQSGPGSIVPWLRGPSSFDHMCLAALRYLNLVSPSLIHQLSIFKLNLRTTWTPTNVDRRARLPCSSARNHYESGPGWDKHF